MTAQKRTTVEQLNAFLNSFLDEWREFPSEAMQSLPENEAMELSEFKRIKDAAYGEAGKRRLARAKKAISEKSRLPSVEQKIDLAVARKYLADAANDSRITLAARDMRDMPDEEVVRLYQQLKELEAEQLGGKF